MWKHKKFKRVFDSYYEYGLVAVRGKWKTKRQFIIYGENARGARIIRKFTSFQAAKKAGWVKVG